MGTITLPNFRTTADVTMNTRLKDGGVYIDWAGLTNIKAWLYSDAQKAMAGRCDVTIDQTDSTKLVCEYSATKPQYLGVNRLIVQGEYMGRTKTYDKPVFNFVRWTDDQAGEELVIDDPIVDVEISVEDVSSSLIERLIAACIKATEEAREVVDVHRGPQGESAYDVAVDNGFEGTEEEWLASLRGEDGEPGPQGPEGPQGPDGTPGVTSAEVTVDGTTGTPSASASVEDGVLSIAFSGLKGEQGQQGEQGEQGEQGVQGPAGPAGVTSAEATVDGTSSPTPTASASVANGLLSLAFTGLKGNPGQDGQDGQDGVGFDDTESPTPADGTFIIHLSNGDDIIVDMNHGHAEYYSKVIGTAQPSGGFLPDVAYNLGEISETVSFALAAAVNGQLNHYFWMFSTGATAPTVTWPAGITWAAGSAPTVAANKKYEISILNGVAYYSEV